jgi:dolichyl-phosphate beta-glucosyltransferase
VSRTLPSLSVVIPALNEAGRLPRTLARILSFLEARSEAYEIVVVDDGSTDNTAEQACSSGGPRTHVLRNHENRGKGFSVRRGMLFATGTRRLMSDADLSTPIEELPRLEACLAQGFDVAVASRAAAGANIEVHQPVYRERVGRAFNSLVRALVVPDIHDTQCGFKLFSGRAADDVFRRSRNDGFAFDVEVLFLARRLGYRVAEIPVTWRNDAASRVGVMNGLLAFLDVLRIRVDAWRGQYEAGQGPSSPTSQGML